MPHRRRYRHWSGEEKCSICRETRAPGVSVAQVARRHALNANLIFKWLKDPRFAAAAAIGDEPVFLPVAVREDDAPTIPMASPASDPHGRVQIVLATGHRMTVEGPFDGDAVARLLNILVRNSASVTTRARPFTRNVSPMPGMKNSSPIFGFVMMLLMLSRRLFPRI